MLYGYARVSTKTQNIERQVRNIRQFYPEALIYKESFTGTKMDRPYWSRLQSRLKDGDVVIFDSVSRMARNAEEGFKTYEELFSRGIDLIFLKEPQINTTTYKRARETTIPLTNTSVDFILEGINRYLFELAKEQIKLAFTSAQREVDDLHQRTKEGLLTAKINGKILGHRKSTPLVTKKSIKVKKTILAESKDYLGTLSDKQLMKLCECSRKSFYKYKKELQEEMKHV